MGGPPTRDAIAIGLAPLVLRAFRLHGSSRPCAPRLASMARGWIGACRCCWNGLPVAFGGERTAKASERAESFTYETTREPIFALRGRSECGRLMWRDPTKQLALVTFADAEETHLRSLQARVPIDTFDTGLTLGVAGGRSFTRLRSRSRTQSVAGAARTPLAARQFVPRLTIWSGEFAVHSCSV
jgi:hypothetical protein